MSVQSASKMDNAFLGDAWGEVFRVMMATSVRSMSATQKRGVSFSRRRHAPEMALALMACATRRLAALWHREEMVRIAAAFAPARRPRSASEASASFEIHPMALSAPRRPLVKARAGASTMSACGNPLAG